MSDQYLSTDWCPQMIKPNMIMFKFILRILIPIHAADDCANQLTNAMSKRVCVRVCQRQTHATHTSRLKTCKRL